MDIIVDFFVEMLFDVYGELMFLVVPEFKGSRNCGDCCSDYRYFGLCWGNSACGVGRYSYFGL